MFFVILDRLADSTQQQTHQKLFPHVPDAFSEHADEHDEGDELEDHPRRPAETASSQARSKSFHRTASTALHALEVDAGARKTVVLGPAMAGRGGGDGTKRRAHRCPGFTVKRVFEGAPPDAGVTTGSRRDKPLAALIEAGRPAWQRIGVHQAADARTQRGSAPSRACRREMGRRHVDETGEETEAESPAPRENPPKTLVSNAVAFRRDVETTEKTRNKTSEENTDGVTRV